MAVRPIINKVPPVWIAENWLIASGQSFGQKYSFHRFPMLQDYANDTFTHKIFVKSSQMGVSEISVALMFYYGDTRPGNHIYFFPTEKAMKTFAKARVIGAVETNPYLLSKVGSAKNTEQLNWNDKWFYFRGAQNESQVSSVDATFLHIDERDLMPQSIVDNIHKRIGASFGGIINEFSTPRYPGAGIDEQFFGSDEVDSSDQRYYFISCNHCGHKQRLDWFLNVVNLKTNEEPDCKCLCVKCKREMDRFAVGEWVAKRPTFSNTKHGYSINKIYSQTADLNKMWLDYKNIKKQQIFYNHDLGIAYAPDGSRITEVIINAHTGSHVMQDRYRHGYTFMGVDVGSKINVEICDFDENRRQRVLKAIEVNNFNDVRDLIIQMNVHTCVIDLMPETQKVRDLKRDDAVGRKVYSATFDSGMKETDTLYRMNPITREIDVNRPLAMSYVQTEVGNGSVIFPADVKSCRNYIPQMRVPLRVRQELPDGTVEYVFPKTGKADHFFFSRLYAMVASHLMPRGQVVEVAGNIHVNAPGALKGKSEFGRPVNA